jgi:ABC-2 type transport system ATP-binding protein
VLLSTHILTEVEMTCHRVLIMNRGSIVASDTPERLTALMQGTPQVVAEMQGPHETILEKLRAIPSISRVTAEANGAWSRFVVESEAGADVRPRIYELAVENRWGLRELRSERRTLEDVFVAMTREVRES